MCGWRGGRSQPSANGPGRLRREIPRECCNASGHSCSCRAREPLPLRAGNPAADNSPAGGKHTVGDIAHRPVLKTRRSRSVCRWEVSRRSSGIAPRTACPGCWSNSSLSRSYRGASGSTPLRRRLSPSRQKSVFRCRRTCRQNWLHCPCPKDMLNSRLHRARKANCPSRRTQSRRLRGCRAKTRCLCHCVRRTVRPWSCAETAGRAQTNSAFSHMVTMTLDGARR
jgi:hypothetical protein